MGEFDWILVKLTWHSQLATQGTLLCNRQLFRGGLIEPPPDELFCIPDDGTVLCGVKDECSFCLLD